MQVGIGGRNDFRHADHRAIGQCQGRRQFGRGEDEVVFQHHFALGGPHHQTGLALGIGGLRGINPIDHARHDRHRDRLARPRGLDELNVLRPRRTCFCAVRAGGGRFRSG